MATNELLMPSPEPDSGRLKAVLDFRSRKSWGEYTAVLSVLDLYFDTIKSRFRRT